MLITDEHIETYAMIDHGNGLTTLYGHCSQLLARVGQTVQEGDIVALSSSTGPHLHFEVRVNGERTNPRAYLPKGRKEKLIMNTAIKPITPEREQELVAKLVDFLSSRYDAGNLYDILRHGLGMDHGDMEALGFQLRDYYEEVE